MKYVHYNYYYENELKMKYVHYKLLKFFQTVYHEACFKREQFQINTAEQTNTKRKKRIMTSPKTETKSMQATSLTPFHNPESIFFILKNQNQNFNTQPTNNQTHKSFQHKRTNNNKTKAQTKALP